MDNLAGSLSLCNRLDPGMITVALSLPQLSPPTFTSFDRPAFSFPPQATAGLLRVLQNDLQGCLLFSQDIFRLTHPKVGRCLITHIN